MPISFVIPSLAQISGLSDVTFTAASVQSDAVSVQNVCVFSNSITRGYTVTATGNGSGSSFRLTNPDGATVAYSVGWTAPPSTPATTPLTATTASTPFTGAAITTDCALGTSSSSSLKITIATSDLLTMSGGTTYTGTLTLVITPN